MLMVCSIFNLANGARVILPDPVVARHHAVGVTSLGPGVRQLGVVVVDGVGKGVGLLRMILQWVVKKQ